MRTFEHFILSDWRSGLSNDVTNCSPTSCIKDPIVAHADSRTSLSESVVCLIVIYIFEYNLKNTLVKSGPNSFKRSLLIKDFSQVTKALYKNISI